MCGEHLVIILFSAHFYDIFLGMFVFGEDVYIRHEKSEQRS